MLEVMSTNMGMPEMPSGEGGMEWGGDVFVPQVGTRCSTGACMARLRNQQGDVVGFGDVAQGRLKGEPLLVGEVAAAAFIAAIKAGDFQRPA